MPLYDYRCRGCGALSELLVRSTEFYVKCPECGSDDMERLVSASYNIRMDAPSSDNTTCCGRSERCEAPPCHTDESCHRH